MSTTVLLVKLLIVVFNPFLVAPKITVMWLGCFGAKRKRNFSGDRCFDKNIYIIKYSWNVHN